jgi:hypothetical protein
MRRASLIALIWIFLSQYRLPAQQAFPDWRGSNVLLPGVWKASPIATVGEVVNARAYGEQMVENLPWPMSPEVHKLYWCVGDFQTIAIVKGNFESPARKYLWASSLPGCKLWDDDPRLIYHRFRTRVWFLREEEGFLRPPFDGGARHFEGFFLMWDERPELPPQQQLGELMLKPAANSDTLEDHAKYLWDVGDVACELLGKAGCVREIRALAEMGNAAMREAACHFLEGQLGEECK